MANDRVEATLLIAVHNEEGNLCPIVDEIIGAFAGWTYEILFVDDGSTDGTAAELNRLKQSFPFIRIVTHLERCGKSTALVTGGRFANYPWIATMDGDGQDEPRDAVTMLEVAARAEQEGTAHFLCVCGHRQNRKDTTIKRISSRIANSVRRSVLKDDTPDTACGLKVFRREDFLTIPHFTNMHRFFPALFVRSGGRTVSVKVNNRPRQRGISKYGFHNRLWVGIADMFGVMWLLRRPANPRVVEKREPHAG
jgi:dolichol-phosphate mannosyltransferase